jgi:hypothetical protein
MFSQAQFGGSDIRFTKADNTFLPYEIERWDSAHSQAEIWVKVDTVFGNDSVAVNNNVLGCKFCCVKLMTSSVIDI